MSFENLGLSRSLLRAIAEEGYEATTPIQSQAIPTVLEGGDLMGCAQTGTGKTAAFALPTLHRLSANNSLPSCSNKRKRRPSVRPARALVLVPTRELAAQVQSSFAKYGRFTGLRTTTIYGGVSQNPQVRALQKGVDILVATPGRLLDLINQGYADLANIEILILDEADQMLDMGFLPDLQKIVAATPRERQTLMFSATMPDQIRSLALRWLRSPKHVQVAPVSSPVESVQQSVYFINARNKLKFLTYYLRSTPRERTLVFARTKHGADKIAKRLVRSGIAAVAIHGNKSQNARSITLKQFKSKDPPVLVATDIAARGIDVEAVSHVINYELPEVAETYVHRIGRTGRAGASGTATSFCGGDERPHLKRIERLTRSSIRVEQVESQYSQQADSSSNEPSRLAKTRSVKESQRGRNRNQGKQTKAGNRKAQSSRGRRTKRKRQKANGHGEKVIST